MALIDLLPTLAELVGLDAPEAQGRSLVPLMLDGGEWPPRHIFAEQLPYPAHPFHMVAALGPDGRKLLRDQTQNVTLLFDIDGRDAELARVLAAFLDADPAPVSGPSLLDSAVPGPALRRDAEPAGAC